MNWDAYSIAHIPELLVHDCGPVYGYNEIPIQEKQYCCACYFLPPDQANLVGKGQEPVIDDSG